MSISATNIAAPCDASGGRSLWVEECESSKVADDGSKNYDVIEVWTTQLDQPTVYSIYTVYQQYTVYL